MKIRPLRRLPAAIAMGVALFSGTAMAADYAVIVLDISVDRPADAVWKKIGGYCDISSWMNLACAYTSGSGDVGTMRRLADRIDEVMVAKTSHSYTYTQPTTTILYHGTLAVQPNADNKGSKIVYTLLYDQEPLVTAEAKAADRARRTKTFTGALKTMKTLAEMP